VGIIAWLVMGLIVGVLAKLIMPGDDPGGLIMTIVIGIVGALLGGWLGTQFGIGGVDGFTLSSIAIATGGALIVLWIYGRFRGRG
jgi:uncharacterized membrane protein YeaQ/YmgE (transglycosylase-associated protein family)